MTCRYSSSICLAQLMTQPLEVIDGHACTWVPYLHQHIPLAVINSLSLTRLGSSFNLVISHDMSPRLLHQLGLNLHTTWSLQLNMSHWLSPGLSPPLAPFRLIILDTRGYPLWQQASLQAHIFNSVLWQCQLDPLSQASIQVLWEILSILDTPACSRWLKSQTVTNTLLLQWTNPPRIIVLQDNQNFDLLIKCLFIGQSGSMKSQTVTCTLLFQQTICHSEDGSSSGQLDCLSFRHQLNSAWSLISGHSRYTPCIKPGFSSLYPLITGGILLHAILQHYTDSMHRYAEFPIDPCAFTNVIILSMLCSKSCTKFILLESTVAWNSAPFWWRMELLKEKASSMGLNSGE